MSNVVRSSVTEYPSKNVQRRIDTETEYDVDERKWEDDEKRYNERTTTKKTTTTTTEMKTSVAGRHAAEFTEDIDYMVVNVHENESNPEYDITSTVEFIDGEVQGVWEPGYRPSEKKTELWFYQEGNEPRGIFGSKHIYGWWGYHPRVLTYCKTKEEFEQLNPADLIFFPPNHEPPQDFDPQGVWTYPMVKVSVAHIKTDGNGFVTVFRTKKANDLDVGGSWKMLYHRPGEKIIRQDKDVRIERDRVRKEELKRQKAARLAAKARSAPPPPPPKPWNIPVKMPSGERINFEVPPNTTTLGDLKKQIEEKEGIPVKNQKFLFGGEPLKDSDDTLLKDTELQNGDELELYTDKMNIHIQHWNGNKFTFKNVPKTATLNQFMDKIERERDIPKRLQRLLFPHEEELLTIDSDNKSLQEYGLKNGDLVELIPIMLNVRTPQGKMVPLQVNPMKDTIPAVKDMMERATGIPANEQRFWMDGEPVPDGPMTLEELEIPPDAVFDMAGMQVYVEDTNGNVYELEVDPTDPLRDIKQKIQQQLGIPTEQQRLVKLPSSDKDNNYGSRRRRSSGGFGSSNNSDKNKDAIPLDDDTKTLRDYVIKHKDVLKLQPMQLFIVSPDGKTEFPIMVNPRDTIDDVKQKVANEYDIPKDEQRYTYRGKVLGDGTTVVENRIPDGGKLKMEEMEIYVKDHLRDGQVYTVSGISPSTSIAQVKLYIDNVHRINKGHQRLFLGPTELFNNEGTLRDYGIQHKETLDMEPMQIQVKLLSGKVLTFDVSPDYKVRDVKAMVFDRAGVPKHEQRLFFGPQELDDAYKLEHYHVEHLSTLDMHPMLLYVEDGELEYQVEAEALESIDTLKNRIERNHGIPKPQQRLFFNGQSLNKDPKNKTLRDYKIKNKSTLALEPMQIRIQNPKNGREFVMAVKPSDTIDDLKAKIAGQERIPVSHQNLSYRGVDLNNDPTSMLSDFGIPHGAVLDLTDARRHLYVKDYDGRVIPIDGVGFLPTDTIGFVKDKIAKQEGIPQHQQRLAYNERPLQDDFKTLDQYDIPDKAILAMGPMEIQVHGSRNDPPIILSVTPKHTIKDVKILIEEKNGTPVNDQTLLFKGKELDNRPTLGDYGIDHGSKLDLEGLTVTVQDAQGNRFHVHNLDPAMKVSQLKDVIEDQEGIPRKDQRLCYGDEELRDGKTLKEHKIPNNGVLTMEPMQIIVDMPDGSELTLECSPADKVSDLKEMIEDHAGVPPDDQHLMFGDKELKDGKTLGDSGVQHGSTIEMLPMQINVKDWKGKKYTMEVPPNIELGAVKSRLQKETGMAPHDQYLLYQKQLMQDNGSTLAEYGIKNKSTLALDRMKVFVLTPKGKFMHDVEPGTTVGDIQNAVNAKFGLAPEHQAPFFDERALDDPNMTMSDLGVDYKDTIYVQEIDPGYVGDGQMDPNLPEYSVEMSEWQDTFSYNPTKPLKPKVGVRAKRGKWAKNKDENNNNDNADDNVSAATSTTTGAVINSNGHHLGNGGGGSADDDDEDLD